YRGIRPAFGYPACPDHSLKAPLFELLGASDAGIELTEHFAMTPAASVSGIYLAHPEARYFNVGRIGRDQVVDYARRKGEDLRETERWLRSNPAHHAAAPLALHCCDFAGPLRLGSRTRRRIQDAESREGGN